MPFNWAAVLNILFTTVFSESLACMLQIADYVKFTYIYIWIYIYLKRFTTDFNAEKHTFSEVFENIYVIS